MKISLKLGPTRPLTRSQAKGCLTANLALPGAGSLVAGRSVGYVQLAFSVGGFLISLIGTLVFLRWRLAHPEAADPNSSAEPFEVLGQIFERLFWPLIGIACFAFATLWAFITSLQILKASGKDQAPPRLS